MLKIDKNFISSLANHLTFCLSVLILGFLFHMVRSDYSNDITEIQHGKILLEKLIQKRE